MVFKKKTQKKEKYIFMNKYILLFQNKVLDIFVSCPYDVTHDVK